MGRPMNVVPYARVRGELSHDLRRGRCAVLAGAGVSMLYPTSLPSGYSLRDQVIREIVDKPALRPHAANLLALPQYLSLRPEMAFQRAHEVIGDRLMSHFSSLSLARPNLGHAILAAGSAIGAVVMTTNFDLLIEACGGSRNILHIHGALADLASMVTRINQVGRGLLPAIADRVKMSVAGRTLYAFGHSAADPDILAALSASTVRRVVWFTRSSLDGDIRARLKELARVHTTVVVREDLAVVFQDIARSMSVSVPSSPPARAAGVTAVSLSPRARLTLGERRAVLAQLLFESGAYEEAASVYSDASAQRLATSRPTAAWCNTRAADCMRMIGASRFKDGLTHVRAAVATGAGYEVAHAYSVEALLWLEARKTPHVRRARLTIQRAVARLPALTSSESEQHRTLRARILNNLGLILDEAGDSPGALTAFRHSAALKRDLGDLRGTCRTAMNIALVCYKAGLMSKYVYWRRRGYGLARQFGFSHEEAYLHRRLGDIQLRLGQTRRARHNLRRARDIYVLLPDAAFPLALTEDLLRGCP